MHLDLDLLAERASYVRDGVDERAFEMEAPEDGRLFSILYRPSELPLRDLGFVVCHSYGLEILTLRRVERAVARALAAQGFPVLALHRRGFGDSSGDAADATLERQIEDVRLGAARLREETRAVRLGLIGARFGGLLAGLAAGEAGADRLLLMNPAVDGRSYFRGMIREVQVVDVSTQDNGARRSTEDFLAALERDGMVDILGHPVYRHLFVATSETSLRESLSTFEGDVLLVQVSKRTGTAKEYDSLAEAIRAGGGTCRLEMVREAPGTTFGGPAFVSVTDPTVRIDATEDMVAQITRLTVDWTIA